jgi:aminoglycoside phosphotransferase (APT) family kinase protein
LSNAPSADQSPITNCYLQSTNYQLPITNNQLPTNMPSPFEALVQKLEPGGKLLSSWKLTGGISAEVTALEIELADGQAKKLVVRSHTRVGSDRSPRVAETEFRLLQVLRDEPIPAPAPYLLDLGGKIFPSPTLVIEFIDGKPDLTPDNLNGFITQLAHHLAAIHSIDRKKAAFLAKQGEELERWLTIRPPVLDETIGEKEIREKVESAWPWPKNQEVLLHGDYWPGNVLCRDGTVVSIIDWEESEIGDPLTDVSIARFDILWAYGLEAMQSFTQQYLALTNVDATHLPYWDLYAALRPALRMAEWAGDEANEKIMRERHRIFVDQAFAILAGK